VFQPYTTYILTRNITQMLDISSLRHWLRWVSLLRIAAVMFLFHPFKLLALFASLNGVLLPSKLHSNVKGNDDRIADRKWRVSDSGNRFLRLLLTLHSVLSGVFRSAQGLLRLPRPALITWQQLGCNQCPLATHEVDWTAPRILFRLKADSSIQRRGSGSFLHRQIVSFL